MKETHYKLYYFRFNCFTLNFLTSLENQSYTFLIDFRVSKVSMPQKEEKAKNVMLTDFGHYKVMYN